MNKNAIEGDWKVLKGKIKQQWAKLTDDDLTRAEGNLDELAGRLQTAYGYTKEKAWEELERLKQNATSNQ